ncbi:MAG: CvpA family protein, partial [Planctomycetaceae bacterium]
MIIDIVLLLVWLGVTWCVASDGAFNAAITCVVVIISGLLAMNFFEPLAEMMKSSNNLSPWDYRWDIVCLLGLFIVFVVLLRYALEWCAPLYHMMEGRANEAGRWG